MGLEKLPYALITTQNTSNVTLEAARELDAVGINPKAIGYEYLTEAIIIATKGNVPNLARQIALKYNKTQASVERAMQNAINRAWSNCNPDDLARNYTAVINYERGVPTLTEFVYHYASKFRNQL